MLSPRLMNSPCSVPSIIVKPRDVMTLSSSEGDGLGTAIPVVAGGIGGSVTAANAGGPTTATNATRQSPGRRDNRLSHSRRGARLHLFPVFATDKSIMSLAGLFGLLRGRRPASLQCAPMTANGSSDATPPRVGAGGRLARRLVFVLAVGLFTLAVNSLGSEWVHYTEAVCRLLF